jgi:hypothetical protein
MTNVEELMLLPAYSKIQPEIRSLIYSIARALRDDVKEMSAKQARQTVQETIATPRQQIEAIEKVVINTLYKPKAEKRMRAVAKSCVSELVFSQTDESESSSKAAKDYHTVAEIRELINNNIQELRDYFGARDLPLSAFCDHLQRYTTLRPGDQIRVTNGRKRWNQQVGSAIHPVYWPDSPITSTSVRGTYIFKPAE